MRVVFVHPSYPNQFTRIAHALAQRAGWDCIGLVDERFTESVRRDDPPIPYYGFRQEAPSAPPDYATDCLTAGVRCGKAVADALAHVHGDAPIDVVVGHASFGTTFFVRRGLGIPVVAYVELPGYFPIYAREQFPAGYPQHLIDTSLRALINASVLEADLCVVPSHHAKRLFPGALQEKVRVQPEGFDLPPPVHDRPALRRELGLPASGPIVGFAGRTLEAVRGFDVFARLCKAIRRERPDVHFLALGDETTIYGNETAHLGATSFKRHVLDREKVPDDLIRFKPFMPHPDFIRHVQAMDLAVFPLFEGAANWAVYDAMAAGVPILASDRCFLPEAITHRETGVLCDPTDLYRFGRAALSMLANPERSLALGLAARRRIASRFSMRHAADGYGRLIREAVRVPYASTG